MTDIGVERQIPNGFYSGHGWYTLMARSLGVVVPAYRPDIELLCEHVTTLHDSIEPGTLRIELDHPSEQVLETLSGLPATVNAVPYRRGKGAAITAGFEAMDEDILSFTDADGSTPIESFATVIDPIRDGEADLSVGSRRHPDATIKSHQTYARRFLGDAFAWFAGMLLDESLYDYQCGTKAIRRESWNAVRDKLYEPGFAWDVELVAIAGALDLQIAEVPIEWMDRPGSTVAPFRTSLTLGRTLLVVHHRAKQLRNDPLHSAFVSRRDDTTTLVDKDE